MKCSLCGMLFEEEDPLFNERKATHERWHSHCKWEKRNITEGKVEWI